MEIVDYQTVKERAIRMGKEELVRQRALELMEQLSEPGMSVSFKDAYEMAYNDIVESSRYLWY
jgi:hypothetical protein